MGHKGRTVSRVRDIFRAKVKPHFLWVLAAVLPSAANAVGPPLPGAQSFPPDTPALIASLPDSYSLEVEEKQVFLLRSAAPATAESVEAHAYCTLRGADDRIPVVVLRGQDRWPFLDLLGESGEAITVLRCREPLPASAYATLHWGPSIATPAAVTLPGEQTIDFQVRRAFSARVNCRPAFPTTDCIPTGDIYLDFTAALPAGQTPSARLTAPEGRVFTPIAGGLVGRFRFAPPFPEATTLQLTLPGEVLDESGRSLANAAEFPQTVRTGFTVPFSGTFAVVDAGSGGRIGVNVESFAGAGSGEPAATLRLLKVETAPKTVAFWLERVREQMNFWGQCGVQGVPRGAKMAGYPHTCRAGTEWLNGTGTTTIFRESDAPIQVTLPTPTVPRHAEQAAIAPGEPGLYIAEIEAALPESAGANPAVKPRYYATTAVLVTHMAVHAEWWPKGALVWVTRLKDGKPVANAEIAVDDPCTGRRLWSGRTSADGIAISDTPFGTLPFDMRWGCMQTPSGFIVSARLANDFSFTLSEWQVEQNNAWTSNMLTDSYRFGGAPVLEGRFRTRSLLKLGSLADGIKASVATANSDSAPSTAAAVRLGVRQEVSPHRGKWRVGIVALGPDGKPRSKQAVGAFLYGVKLSWDPYVRQPGGFYITTEAVDRERLGATCAGFTDSSGRFVCDLPVPRFEGSVAVRAETQTAAGQRVGATILLWDTDIEPGPGNALFADKVAYLPGQTAHLQARTPFASPIALVTVEKDGVIKSFVQRLSGPTPTVDIPILAAYEPAVGVSVFAVSHTPKGSPEKSGEARLHKYLSGGACIVVRSREPPEPQVEPEDVFMPEWPQTSCRVNSGVRTATMFVGANGRH